MGSKGRIHFRCRVCRDILVDLGTTKNDDDVFPHDSIVVVEIIDIKFDQMISCTDDVDKQIKTCYLKFFWI